ncbi:U-box domain-containing protein 3 [Linum perenne]
MEDYVLQNLFNGGRDAQIQAATQLGKLTSKSRTRLVENGVIIPLISMLQSQHYEAIEASLFALLSIAFGSERNKKGMVKSGVVVVLLDLLQWRNESLTELTVAALLILSSCTPNKPVIANSGAIQHLVELLLTTTTAAATIQSKLDALTTLHNLSTCTQAIPSIVSSGLVFTLLQLITTHQQPQLVEKAMALLETVTISSEMAVAQASGGIQALVETIEEGSLQCKEHAVGVLVLICQSCRDKYRGLILREGAMPGLLQLSVDGTWRARNLAQELLLMLRDCGGYESRGKQWKQEMVEQIMQEIDAQGDDDDDDDDKDDEQDIGSSSCTSGSSSTTSSTGRSTLRLVEEMIAKLTT